MLVCVLLLCWLPLSCESSWQCLQAPTSPRIRSLRNWGGIDGGLHFQARLQPKPLRVRVLWVLEREDSQVSSCAGPMMAALFYCMVLESHIQNPILVPNTTRRDKTLIFSSRWSYLTDNLTDFCMFATLHKCATAYYYTILDFTDLGTSNLC